MLLLDGREKESFRRFLFCVRRRKNRKVDKMTEAIIVAIITGGLTLVGTIITVVSVNAKSRQEMQIAQAVTDTKLEALADEVRKHNDFANRVPVLEEKMKVANNRIADLEEKIK